MPLVAMIKFLILEIYNYYLVTYYYYILIHHYFVSNIATQSY